MAGTYSILTPAEQAEFGAKIVAFEMDGDQYPALVGMIVTNFAHIERELPTIVERMTGLAWADAITIFAEFRAFSVRLEVLSALLKLRDETSHDRVVYSHCKGLLKEASDLRNRYAHAKYYADAPLPERSFRARKVGRDPAASNPEGQSAGVHYPLGVIRNSAPKEASERTLRQASSTRSLINAGPASPSGKALSYDDAISEARAKINSS